MVQTILDRSINGTTTATAPVGAQEFLAGQGCTKCTSAFGPLDSNGLVCATADWLVFQCEEFTGRDESQVVVLDPGGGQ